MSPISRTAPLPFPTANHLRPILAVLEDIQVRVVVLVVRVP